MPTRKPFDEQGGSSQKATTRKAVAAEHGAVDDVVLVQKKKREIIWLLNIVDMQHWTVKQHGAGFKNGAGAK